MDLKELLEAKFVKESDIPAEHTLPGEIDQREYLSNGEMKKWNGDVHTVLSPICIRTNDGLKRKVIGTYPVCTAKEAMEALDAAVAAYNNGCGEWPTMTVAERIKRVEKF